ncbi:MAG: hypothetical protein H7248_07875 [Microbacteriaceae bacterium]|nr:hypothetical protein [Microbacteriaceae bacterium]
MKLAKPLVAAGTIATVAGLVVLSAYLVKDMPGMVPPVDQSIAPPRPALPAGLPGETDDLVLPAPTPGPSATSFKHRFLRHHHAGR